jgi:hypothetical protein
MASASCVTRSSSKPHGDSEFDMLEWHDWLI